LLSSWPCSKQNFVQAPAPSSELFTGPCAFPVISAGCQRTPNMYFEALLGGTGVCEIKADSVFLLATVFLRTPSPHLQCWESLGPCLQEEAFILHAHVHSIPKYISTLHLGEGETSLFFWDRLLFHKHRNKKTQRNKKTELAKTGVCL